MMSRLMITSDLHLGHNNICKYRTEFATAEEHHETLFENLAANVNKRDSLIMLGDMCFSKEWLERIKTIKCAKTTLIVGNHDLEFGIHMRDLVETYDAIYSLWSKRNFWFSHAPIHPQEMRGKKANIHGHLHGNMVWKRTEQTPHMNEAGEMVDYLDEIDTNYINVCVEHTDWKPVLFQEAALGY